MIGVKDVLRGANTYHPSHRYKTLKQRIKVKTNELESILAKSDLIISEVEMQSVLTMNGKTEVTADNML
ncbi:hypothetical protein ES705_39135 [subsurface metagenome]